MIKLDQVVHISVDNQLSRALLSLVAQLDRLTKHLLHIEQSFVLLALQVLIGLKVLHRLSFLLLSFDDGVLDFAFDTLRIFDLVMVEFVGVDQAWIGRGDAMPAL